jgi:hypothetical protein
MKYQNTAVLTRTSKMPGKSFGIGAWRCKTGGKLAKLQGSTCSKCYALKGAYTWRGYNEAEAKRWDLINRPEEFKAMMIKGLNRLRKPEFRWFDSGDVQSEAMAHMILDICEATQKLTHWIPSREIKIWRNVLKTRKLPDNVTLRISAHMIDAKPVADFPNTSTVHKNQEPIGHVCPAPKQGGECRDCRACWSRDVANVSYHQH